MKRLSSLALIIITVILSSCAPKEAAITRDGGQIYRGIDFREYTEDGFLFTMEPPEGEYKSIGILEVTLTPKVISSTKRIYEQHKDSAYTINFDEPISFMIQKTGEVPAEYYGVELLGVDDAIDRLYKMASKMGADAMVNLSVSRNSNFNKIYIEEVTVSGFAIKRLGMDK